MHSSARACLLFVTLTIGSFAPVSAGLDVDFGASIPVGDDARLFFNISSRYFDRDVQVVQHWYGRYHDPDDLAVAFYIADRCHRSPEWVFSARSEGVGWFEIGSRCELPYDAWFVPVAHDPGPPYGKAYGYWKKHRQNPRSRPRLSDDDCRRLVGVRMAHEYYGVPVETAMQWRSSRDVQGVMTHEYRNRREHGREHEKGHDDHGSSKHGKGHHRN